MGQADIGLIGLAVMGQNLALNMNDHGFIVTVYNRTRATIDSFLNGSAQGSKIIGAPTIQEFCQSLKRPRKVILMVKAGEPVDACIQQLIPYLEPGDVIIDGGNSLFSDTNRRTQSLKEKGLLFIGSGISGGEEGARHGPSIMPGGNPEAWPLVKNIFQSISAKADNGEPCCDWVGDEGAGHYVKMVHNGIEYGDMQLICEAYSLLKHALRLNPQQIAQVFAQWNKTELDSYLIEITSAIFKQVDEDGQPLIDKILDVAGQKGTGKWTVINALELGMPLTLIGEAVFARCLSAIKEERLEASKILTGPSPLYEGDQEAFIESIRQALYASKIISYAQGFMLIQQAARDYHWRINFGGVALMWRGGCIIRSKFLNNIKDAYEKKPTLKNLLLDDFFKNALAKAQSDWRRVVAKAVELGIPTPCFSTALAFYDGYRSSNLPANLLQAQRDYFGAHTYERLDHPRGQVFHTNWTGTGGKVSSTSYNA
ncbi:6-phosphogluconate dehydrogenase, decarboxylating [Neochlamydia sp. AcF65]|uniref:decarboxylating NADP(+)-dependent phosphogluconate dehydrogenase n=1 Tax=unclassified Neochlamydia TaxID=2643326 RepID=UPI00140B559E|nr:MULTISPECIES: decarboxylating NADP(+)-dependent phosphogluconate dehydrogenase [unclassified Neochlamydia]MBS4167295.1 6-phosphogluconate dehydrogenase, decarboxylating [Neochlamydia sp. AcF65]NGY95145.1 6-phosphogluconate dehydrogenase, decarboxylating [Neochlamydia sp. AcF84]